MCVHLYWSIEKEIVRASALFLGARVRACVQLAKPVTHGTESTIQRQSQHHRSPFIGTETPRKKHYILFFSCSFHLLLHLSLSLPYYSPLATNFTTHFFLLFSSLSSSSLQPASLSLLLPQCATTFTTEVTPIDMKGRWTDRKAATIFLEYKTYFLHYY